MVREVDALSGECIGKLQAVHVSRAVGFAQAFKPQLSFVQLNFTRSFFLGSLSPVASGLFGSSEEPLRPIEMLSLQCILKPASKSF